MKRLIVAALCLSLAACASYQNPITITTQYDVEAGYLTAENIALVYIEACRTGAIKRSVCGPVVAVIQTSGRKAQAAVLALRNFTKNNPTLNNASLLLAAQNALADFQFAVSASQASGS